MRDHVVKILGQPGGNGLRAVFPGIYLVVKIHPLLVHVAERHQGGGAFVNVQQGLAEHEGTCPGADQGVTGNF